MKILQQEYSLNRLEPRQNVIKGDLQTDGHIKSSGNDLAMHLLVLYLLLVDHLEKRPV